MHQAESERQCKPPPRSAREQVQYSGRDDRESDRCLDQLHWRPCGARRRQRKGN